MMFEVKGIDLCDQSVVRLFAKRDTMDEALYDLVYAYYGVGEGWDLWIESEGKKVTDIQQVITEKEFEHERETTADLRVPCEGGRKDKGSDRGCSVPVEAGGDSQTQQRCS